jgi:hypothetical protein
MPFVDERSASTLIDHREIDGLHLAVRDCSQRRAAEKHFGRDLVDVGYVPVVVLLELDASSNGAYSIRREDIRLVLRDGTRLDSAVPAKVIEDAGFSHWRSFFAYLFLLPGPFVSSSVASANVDLEEDYLAKSLQSVRLSRNLTSYSGVVFFERGDKVDGDVTLTDAFVEVAVFKEGQKAAGDSLGKRLDFTVHFTE